VLSCLLVFESGSKFIVAESVSESLECFPVLLVFESGSKFIVH